MDDLVTLEIKEENVIKRSDRNREMSFNGLFDMIDKRFNKSMYYYDEIKEIGKIQYGIEVVRQEDKKTYLLLGYPQYDYISFIINTEGYPELKNELEKYRKITLERFAKEQSYYLIQEKKHPNYRDYFNSIDYMKKLRNKCLKRILIMLSSFLFSALIFYLISILPISPGSIILGIMLGLAIGPPCLVLSSIIVDKQYLNTFKSIFTLQHNIRKAKRKLSKMKSNDIFSEDEIETREENNNVYKDNIMNYMNLIMKSANKLNKEDRKQKLLELKSILEEYTSKLQEINNSDSKELTFDNNRKLMMKTVEKLTTLEMEISDLLKRDNKNEKVFYEKEKLMKELERNINSIESKEEQVSVSKGR